MKSFDVVVVGGGPGGLSAALLLGRGRAVTLLVDGGTPRNARAHEVHTFLTRDGIPPAEFRAVARAQLTPYPSVEVRDGLVSRITKLPALDAEGFGFEVVIDAQVVRARRILLATGMRDELPPIEGLARLWGGSVFQCPYCHGWERRDRPWGVLVDSDMMAGFAPFVSNWASHVTAFTNGAALGDAAREALTASVVTVEVEPIARLHGETEIEAVELASGRRVPCAALAMRPPQRHVEVVLALGLALDEQGFVRVDPRTMESSMPGVHVAGDATTMMQGAIKAAADGVAAAAVLNHGLVMERLARSAVARSPAALR